MAKLADLYLAGTGLGDMSQLTQETRDVLSRCRIILHATQQHEKLLEINPNTVNLEEHYWTGEDVNIVYARLFKMIMDEVRRGPGVASVTEGHPLFYDDCHMKLLKTCKRQGLKCVALAAVSCLDTLSVDLGIDYVTHGLQVFEASMVVDFAVKMNPHVHTLLLQVGEFGTNVTPDHVETTKGMFVPLEKYLCKFYPSSHRAVVCFSANNGYDKVTFASRVDKLDFHRNKIEPGSTLYLPPVP